MQEYKDIQPGGHTYYAAQSCGLMQEYKDIQPYAIEVKGKIVVV